MRVLHIINSLVVGGAERLLKDSINGIAQFKPETEQHLITLYEGGKILDEIDGKVKYLSLNAHRLDLPFKIITLRNYIRKNKIDIVHAHLYDAMIIARLAVPRNVKFVNTYHNGIYNPSSVEYSYKRKLIDILTLKKRFHTIFVSEAVKNDISRGIKFKGPATVLPNFPSPSFKGNYIFNDSSQLKLISVGTLRHPKNHEHSVEVMAKLKDADITLDIFGYGPREKVIKKMIKDSGAKINIINDKIVDPEIFSRYDAFFMSSLQEGMSIALLEAMSCGVPPVVSDIESFRETAINSAMYFKLGNAEHAANTLRHIYKNKEVLKDLSQNAKKLSAVYTLENHLTKLFNIYTHTI